VENIAFSRLITCVGNAKRITVITLQSGKSVHGEDIGEDEDANTSKKFSNE